MGRFIHTPDDKIVIDELIMPLSFWMTQEPSYSLPTPPTGATHQEYIQTVHRYVSSTDQQEQYSIPWIQGDTYISNKATYQAAYDTYKLTSQTLDQAKKRKISELSYYREDKRAEGVTYDSTDYMSDYSTYSDMFHDHEYSLRAEALPSGYYVWKLDETKDTTLTLADLTGIIDKIQEFYWKLRENFDTHRIAIDALTTIQDVLDYNFTTGWPTTPYT